MLRNQVIKPEKSLNMMNAERECVNSESVLIMYFCDLGLQANTIPASAGAG